MFNHSPERDQKVFEEAQMFGEGIHESQCLDDTENHCAQQLMLELVGIAKKWRAKATMRASKIEDLEQENAELAEIIEYSGVDADEMLALSKENK